MESIHIIEALVISAHLLGLLSAAHAIWFIRSSQGAIAWALSLVIFPYLVVPFYWVFGRRTFQGYQQTLRKVAREHQPHLHRELRRLEDFGTREDDARKLDRSMFSSLAEMPWTSGNHLLVLPDGKAAFDAMFEAIDAAKHYVLVQFYILRDDQVGGLLADKLIAAVARGVRAYLLFDEIGCIQLSDSWIKRLRDGGVKVSAFYTRRGHGNRFQINFRNHRKVLVVDGRVAFTGGLNVGDEYLGPSRKFASWRDTHLRVEGPAALSMEMVFLADWYWARRELIPVSERACAHATGRSPVLVFPSGPVDEDNQAEQFVVGLIGAARSRLWIASPYFVPGDAVLTALKMAVRRGVDVRILLPEERDHFFVNMAAYAFIPECVAAGVRVMLYQGGFMHQKVMLVDHDLAAVGTLNLDARSLQLNFELTVLSSDQAFASEIAGMLEKDFERCRPAGVRELDEKPLWFRFSVKFARLFEPIL